MIGFNDNEDALRHSATYAEYERGVNEARHMSDLNDRAAIWIEENRPEVEAGSEAWMALFEQKMDEWLIDQWGDE